MPEIHIPTKGEIKQLAEFYYKFKNMPSSNSKWTNLNVNQIYLELTNQIMKEEKEIISKIKDPKDLIIKLDANIDSVYGKTLSNVYNTSNGILGPEHHSQSHSTGQSSMLEISLKHPQVKKLIFPAYAPLRADDNITAYIDKKEITLVPNYFREGFFTQFKDAGKYTLEYTNFILNMNKEKEQFYFERSWELQETTKKIELNHKNGSCDTFEII